MPVFLGGPEIVPPGPDAVGAEVDGKQTMEVRESFLGKQIQGECDARRIAYSSCPLSERFQMAIRIFSRWRLQQLRGKPKHAFGFVRRHQLGDDGLEIGEHLDLR